MIKPKTTLVLGAGASLPYGFPSGAELISRILDNLADKASELRISLARCDVNQEYIHRFRTQLLASDCKSIDSFIYKDKDRTELGKLCIAHMLMKAERDSIADSEDKLLTARVELKNKSKEAKADHWYAILKQALEVDSPDKLKENKLTVVTFNYDRSLEYYLFRALCADYGEIHEKEVIAALKAIEFIHVYGQLGTMPWAEDANVFEYGTLTLHPPDLRRVSKRITVMNEAVAQNNFERAHAALASADKIVFLGFGFHEANLQGLKTKSILNSKVVTGTRMGISPLKAYKLRTEYPLLYRIISVDEGYSSSDLLEHEILLDGGYSANQMPSAFGA